DLKSIVKDLVNKGYDYELLKNYFKSKKYIINEKNVSKVSVYYYNDENAAVRQSLDVSFNSKKIKSVCNEHLQKILKTHLDKYTENSKDVVKERPDLAFSPEGVDEMNKLLNKPIYKVRIFEPIGKKFAVGYNGNKKDKYVETAKGTNLFFAIYSDENNNRTYDSIPLNIVIERQKQGLSSVPETDKDGKKLLFTLSPNDLVYVPSEEEMEAPYNIDFSNLSNEQVGRVYKIVSFTGNRLYAIQNNIAMSIKDKFEFTLLNKLEFDLSRKSIKKVCFKLKIDRIGNLRSM
ncbi:MAG: type II CRISPR RNA-guided endonuclease Cas9, partial [Bacteroidota bacterium]|nr:type II CRISPR RNA-guided endonuclease Cas9 [Bacteroidota bacterium]